MERSEGDLEPPLEQHGITDERKTQHFQNPFTAMLFFIFSEDPEGGIGGILAMATGPWPLAMATGHGH